MCVVKAVQAAAGRAAAELVKLRDLWYRKCQVSYTTANVKQLYPQKYQ